METETLGGMAHRPVLVAEALAALSPRPGGVYCDATLGLGGHAEQILLASAPDGRLFGIDRDQAALERATRRLARFGDRFVPLHGAFGDIAPLLAGKIDRLDGLLADLGVSSLQLDEPERGFSFQSRGPIDMRMDRSRGETALDLIARIAEDRLADILREYGEERYARRIAGALKQAAADGELADTLALAAVVERAVPTREGHKHPATRTFQALRIAVNDELRQIHGLLSAAPRLLRPDGRLVVISFHSLEDRLVKQHLGRRAVWAAVHRRSITPGDEELAANWRARSARLRAASLLPAAARQPADEERPAW